MVGSDAPSAMRPIPLAKAILLSMVTLSVYFWIQVWRNSHDIQTARSDGFSWWPVMFVLGFFTFGAGFIALYVLNLIQVGRIRSAAGTDNVLGIVALGLCVVTVIVGPIIWAIHWNTTVQATGHAPAATAQAAAPA